jgi:Cytochrome c3/Cytochrome c554 and c-prime
MRARLLLVLVALGFLAAPPSRALADSCIECHELLPEPLGPPVEGMKHDVHAAAGLSCADCHGGNPDDPDESAMAPAAGFVGKPDPAAIPAFCGRCHADEAYMRRYDPALPTDQLSQYWTSIHGMRLRTGDTKVATCISCHGVHGILPGKDAASPVHKTQVAHTCARCHADAAYMAPYGIPTTQLAEYETSVHGKRLLIDRDTAAPTCNDCHGNHGAYPPGASSVAAVCGQCHAVQRELFEKSPHAEPYRRLGLPACANHHGPHAVTKTSDEMVGVGKLSTCIACHDPGSSGYQAAATMAQALQSLVQEVANANDTLQQAARAGMDVGEAQFQLQAAREALVNTRNLVHAFDPAPVEKAAGDGVAVAEGARRAGLTALAELHDRRWLAIIPLGIIALTCGLLYAKIRSRDRART